MATCQSRKGWKVLQLKCEFPFVVLTIDIATMYISNRFMRIFGGFIPLSPMIYILLCCMWYIYVSCNLFLVK